MIRDSFSGLLDPAEDTLPTELKDRVPTSGSSGPEFKSQARKVIYFGKDTMPFIFFFITNLYICPQIKTIFGLAQEKKFT